MKNKQKTMNVYATCQQKFKQKLKYNDPKIKNYQLNLNNQKQKLTTKKTLKA